MNPALDILSPRAEQLIKQTNVSAVNHQNEGNTTRPGGLKGCESSGCLSQMSRPQFLTLSVYAGMTITVRDIQELQNFILTDFVMHQAWYTQGDYFRSLELKGRIDGFTLNAIMNLVPNKEDRPTTVEMARNMGITVSGFNYIPKQGDSWATRIKQVNRHTQAWLEHAAKVVHYNGQLNG